MSLSVSASTRGSLTLSHSLDLHALSWAKTRAALRILPPRSPDPLVRDPRGPARLLRIREYNLDNVKNPMRLMCSIVKNIVNCSPLYILLYNRSLFPWVFVSILGFPR